jgi:hypothetical protein
LKPGLKFATAAKNNATDEGVRRVVKASARQAVS